MPPESGILYRNRVTDGNDPSTYIGVIRVREPDYYPMNETIHRRIADLLKRRLYACLAGLPLKRAPRLSRSPDGL